MKILDNQETCSGCSACLNICPKHAIVMKVDEKGFLYPYVDENKCVNCGLCKKVCPLAKQRGTKVDEGVDAFVAKNNLKERLESSSGGVFSAFASQIIERQGSVYGAQFDECQNIVHGRANNMTEMKEFRGSKYSQSAIEQSYKDVLKDLSEGRDVYFSGCPCQVAGLYSFLELQKCSTERLYTQDFICHGVASPKFYHDYLKFYEKKYHSKAKRVNFRGKPKEGKFQNMTIDFENGKRYQAISTNQDIFYYHFLQNLILRPSCYQCVFATLDRVADVTLADCFHIKDEMKEFDDRRGLSFIMANTDKGKYLMKKASEQISVKKVDVNDYMQVNMKMPTKKPTKYEVFWNEYINKGFLSAISKYGNYNVKNRFKKLIITIINILGIDEFVKRKMKR